MRSDRCIDNNPFHAARHQLNGVMETLRDHARRCHGGKPCLKADAAVVAMLGYMLGWRAGDLGFLVEVVNFLAFVESRHEEFFPGVPA